MDSRAALASWNLGSEDALNVFQKAATCALRSQGCVHVNRSVRHRDKGLSS